MRNWLRNSLVLAALTSLLTITPFNLPENSQNPQVTPIQLSGIQKQRELLCLAKNIYFESRGEPFHGQIAVAQVTLNRVQHNTNFKSTICGVVYEKQQFSWTDSKLTVKDAKAWREAQLIAAAVVSGTLRLPDFNALYFHTKQVKPVWRKTKKIVRVIGNHIFYA